MKVWIVSESEMIRCICASEEVAKGIVDGFHYLALKISVHEVITERKLSAFIDEDDCA